MFLIRTDQELLSAFRPRDRKQVTLAPELAFPLKVKDYLAWSDPAGGRVYLVFQDEVSRRPLGIAFRNTGGHADGSGPLLCDWCHASGSRGEIGLLTAEMSSKKRVGVELCIDLGCAGKLEQACERTGRSEREPIRRLVERMARFAREGLGIERVPDDTVSAQG